MKQVRYKLMAALLLLLLTFSGCYRNTAIIDLLSPPKLTVEQADIWNALTTEKGTALRLKYPRTGQFLSAFVFVEPAKRVIVFYELLGVTDENGESEVQLTLLENGDGGWKCVYTYAFSTDDIDEVAFSSLGDSKREDIIISHSFRNQHGTNLIVISLGENSGEAEPEYFRNYCVYYEIGDFDGSGRNLLLTIGRSGVDLSRTVAEFVGWSKGDFRLEYSIEVNSAAAEYVRTRKASGEALSLPHIESALFLEYAQSENLFNTDIILWNKTVWVRPDNLNFSFAEFSRAGEVKPQSFDFLLPPHNIVYSRNDTLKRTNLGYLKKEPNLVTAFAYSRDIDGSGTIFAAGNRTFPGYEQPTQIPSNEQPRAAVWYRIIGNNELERTYYTYLGLSNDYVFFFHEKWRGNVTVIHNAEENTVSFYDYNDSHHEYENITEFMEWHGREDAFLMSIATVKKGTEVDLSGYRLFDNTSNPQFDYYTKTAPGAIGKGELKRRLIVFDGSY